MKNLALSIIFLIAASTAFSQKPKTEVSRFLYQTRNLTITPQPVDTTLTGVQNHNPLYSSFSSWSDLGNTGLPALINQYRPIREALNPMLFEGSDGYGTHHSDLVFYSANSPYSVLGYNSGGTADKNGQTIKAVFARNLKKQGNITVFGNYSNSDGHFSKQKCNSSVIRTNYILKRKNYDLVTGFSRHQFGFDENGGLKSDDQLAGAYLSNLLAVRLSGAATKIGFLTLQGVQTFALKQKGIIMTDTLPADSTARDSIKAPVLNSNPFRISHSFKISTVSRRYSDVAADAGFYQNTYSTDKINKDSMNFLSWTNDVSLLSDTIHLGKFPVMLKGGINPDFYRYQRDTLVSSGFALGINGRISKKDQFSYMELAGSFTPIGFSAGDYNLTGEYKLIPGKQINRAEISIELFTRGYSPDPIIQSYQSNHFKWNNNFSRQHESGLNIEWTIPKQSAVLSAGIVSNIGRIYFDTLGMPAQMTEGMTVFSGKASKDFKAGVFRSSVSGLVQYSTSDRIRLPLFVGSASTFIHHDIHFPATGGDLQVEYGIDFAYSTAFYGYAYMPATGIFYAQNERSLGNYPNLSAFVQMKVKRTRIFVQWCQTFSDMLPAESFAVLHYPSMRPHLKYGFYWHFYD